MLSHINRQGGRTGYGNGDRIRGARVDFDHLTAKGWLTASAFVDNPIGRTPIALYRTRDLDHLTSHAATNPLAATV